MLFPALVLSALRSSCGEVSVTDSAAGGEPGTQQTLHKWEVLVISIIPIVLPTSAELNASQQSPIVSIALIFLSQFLFLDTRMITEGKKGVNSGEIAHSMPTKLKRGAEPWAAPLSPHLRPSLNPFTK